MIMQRPATWVLGTDILWFINHWTISTFRHALFGGVVSSMSWLCQVTLSIIKTIFTYWPGHINNNIHVKRLEVLLPSSSLRKEAVRSMQSRKCLVSMLWFSSYSNISIVGLWKPDSPRRAEIANRFPMITNNNRLSLKKIIDDYLYSDYVAFDLY
jgi:hypothetical protein